MPDNTKTVMVMNYLKKNKKLMLTLSTLLVVIIFCVGYCKTELTSKQGTKSMIILKVFPERQNYIIGEEIQLVIQISNKYTHLIAIPDPTKLSLPSTGIYNYRSGDPSGKAFSLSSLSQEKGGINNGQSNVSTIKIEPDSTWEDIIPVSSLILFTLPGEYKISSSIKSDTITTESPECTFNISKLDLQTAYLGLGTRPLEEGEVKVRLFKNLQLLDIYTLLFSRKLSDIGETEIISLVNRGLVSQVANEVIVPWRNSPFFSHGYTRLFPVLDDLVDQAVLERVGRLRMKSRSVSGRSLERLSRCGGEDLVEPLAQAQDFLGVDVDVGGLPLEAARAAGGS